jgi:hypothetical protein
MVESVEKIPKKDCNRSLFLVPFSSSGPGISEPIDVMKQLGENTIGVPPTE